MENSDMGDRLDAVLRADAQEVARRTLLHKFGRLSNRRILATLKEAMPADLVNRLADGELLDKWFAEYEAAVVRLRGSQVSKAS